MAGTPEPRIYDPPRSSALGIVHADASIIVADKPSGLLSVPGKGADKQASALHYLEAKFGEVYDVHRLDMDTSGLIVFARTREAQQDLAGQFRERRIVKTYDVIVEGRMESPSGRIDLAIGRRWEDRPRRCIDDVHGKPSLTDWIRVGTTENRSHLKLCPQTGRTHQLRVHLSAIGHPIIGDRLYGSNVTNQRLQLHASRLKFTHPDTLQTLEITSVFLFEL